ncbi:MAG: hypothetical protein MJ072_06475, partial [Clostridia bacterium]|nr:hypothetical protein [Clostridia bacterium]
MGNSCGDVKDYWDVIYKYDEIMGAFVWEYTDHGVKTEKGFLYGGDNGEVIHDGNFCVDGLVTPDRKIHSSFEEVKKVYEYLTAKLNGNRLTLTSRKYFTNLSGTVTVTVKTEGKTVSEKVYDVNLKPNASVTFTFEKPAFNGYSAVYYSYKSNENGLIKEGTELAKGYFELSSYKFQNVKGKEIDYVVDKKTGAFNITADGKNVLTSPLSVNVLRAFTDNDINEKARWNDYGILRSYQFVESLEEIKGKTVVKGYYGANTTPPYIGYVMTLTKGEGYVDVDFEYRTRMHIQPLPRVGFAFALPKQNKAEYLGLGDGENYVDKCNYVVKDVFGFNPDENLCPYIRPQEYGSHQNVD